MVWPSRARTCDDTSTATGHAMTSRRALLSSFVSSVPAAAALAQGAAPVITVILLDDDPGPALLRKELLRFGWTDGQNVRMSVRNAGGQPRLIPELTRQAVAEMPRLIVAQSAISFAALRRETDTIPIVVIAVTDPLGAGLSKSISRPTGNFTGYLSLGEELPLKHLQFLRTILPQARKVALLLDPANPAFVAVYATAQVGARAFGWDIVVAGYGTPDEILPAIDHEIGRAHV